jgi:hypothetical protein
VGRLNLTNYSDLVFSIDGKRYGPYKLVAFALAENLREKGAECAVTLLVPESLVTYLANSPEEAEELLRNKERYAEQAAHQLREVIAADFEVKVIQGLGSYKLGKKDDPKGNLEFENSIGNISSYVLVELTEISDRDEKLIFCTSTGHNAYLMAVQMALSVYRAYRAFVDQASGDGGQGEFVLKTAFHPDPSVGNEVTVELEPTHHRAFFDLPELRGQLVADQNDRAIELRKGVHDLVEEMMGEWNKARLAFNAVRYNAPLVLNYLEEPDGRKMLRLLREAMEVIEEARSFVIEGSTLRLRRFKVDRGEVSGWVITAALSMYLSKVMESVKSTGGRLGRIFEVMKRVYEDQRLKLNSYVLEYEADQIYEAVKEGMMPGEKRLLKDLLQLKGSRYPKRNFFAHAGLLADYTYVRRTEDGDVAPEYDANRLKEIMSWVRNPTPRSARGATRT